MSLTQTYTWLPAKTLAKRELVRFYRQRSRITAAIATPLMLWFFVGSGVSDSFRSDLIPNSISYLEYFYPGTLVLVVLFSALFSNISVIQDRQSGFLQSVLVAPVSAHSLVSGKILGSGGLAISQGMLLLVLGPFIGLPLTIGTFFLAVFVLSLNAILLSSIGFIFAWRMDSVQGFHGLMSLVFFPLWMLSGALFPLVGAPIWIKALAYINPLTYGMDVLRSVIYLGSEEIPSLVNSPLLSVGVLSGFCLLFYFQALRAVNQKRLGGML